MWYLDNRVPSLGEVRGKVVMFSRFGGDAKGWEGGTEGIGIHPTRWPDSKKEGFIWECKNTAVRIHDWLDIFYLVICITFTSLRLQVSYTIDTIYPGKDGARSAELATPLILLSDPYARNIILLRVIVSASASIYRSTRHWMATVRCWCGGCQRPPRPLLDGHAKRRDETYKVDE
jgi:hypothetical protein